MTSQSQRGRDSRSKLDAMATRLPSTFRKIVVQKLTSNFREAASVVETPMPSLGPSEILIKNRFVGVNASDINYTAGRYDPGVKPPFDVGFEGIGKVVAVGSECKGVGIGQPVTYMHFGTFSEYMKLPERVAIPVPTMNPEFVPLLVSGLTAALALDKVGEIRTGETVLVTAAAGGTGQFAVQLAKEAGCHVIGTCSSEEKVKFLQELGCDRVINYKQESVKDVLKSDYPKGIDVIYESVGGEMFDICVNSLARRGRLVVIGFISGYHSDTGIAISKSTFGLPAKLLSKSASVRGFFLNHFFKDIPQYLPSLIARVANNTLKSTIDNGLYSPNGPFKGVESVFNAVDYIYSRKNVGKVVVELPDCDTTTSKL